jgi:dienelactone hydrolase
MDEAAAAHLARIDPTKVRTTPARRVLVIGRDDIVGHEDGLIEHMRSCGAEVTRSNAAGYSLALADSPNSSAIPAAAWSAATAWLLEVLAPAPTRIVGSVLRPETASEAASIAGMREEAVRFNGLFGIVTEPEQGGFGESAPSVLLLNIGANHRIGSNRMYVRWAREWAALGFRVMRMDLSSIGDSPARHGDRNRDVFNSRHVLDVRMAMDFLAQRGGSAQFALVGVCSGAYMAYRAALEDQRVCSAIIINNQTFHWRAGDSLEQRSRKLKSTDFYRRLAMSPDTWWRTLRGRVEFRMLLTGLAVRLAKRLVVKISQPLIKRGLLTEPDEVARGFQALCDRSCDVLLVNGANDRAVDVVDEHLGSHAEKLRNTPGFKLVTLDGTDHTFTPLDAQHRLIALLTEHLLARYGPARHAVALSASPSGASDLAWPATTEPAPFA